MLQLKNIEKSYTTGDFTQIALDNVSLNFKKNGFVAISGQSGSGKTTCLNIIGGLDQYDSGDLIINSKSTKEFKDSDWDAYRNNKEDAIIYSDFANTMTEMTGSIMDGITIVLIAFAGISLIVSLIMIGIITYISVLERTKEIGILRALGARKKDITRVFNAETFIIGTFSGILGIGIAYLLTFPVNIVIENMTGLTNVAQLNPLHALSLLGISVALTLFGGMLPARMAAKKDPVEALRTE